MVNITIDENASDKELLSFVQVMVQRGLGLYGVEEMAKICYKSGIALTDDFKLDWMDENHEKSVEKLLINYGEKNLPAKMTAIVLARKHGIKVPEQLLEKKKSKKRRFRFKRRSRSA